MAKFPVAHFVSTSIKDKGGDKYDVVGQLSLKGATRDAIIPVAVKKDAAGNTVAEGSFVVKRLDYKIGEGLWGDTNTVANDVTVRVRIVLAPAK
jgi:polyisoprenoid-binding protein YceI